MFFRKKTPVVFVHGMLGSMGRGILKGTGELHFGIAEIAYGPMINTFKSLGYIEDVDLFIAYYDWTKGNEESAKNYLIPAIEKAKEKSGSKNVDLVCHSMGGLVARSYLQSDQYKYDINKLIMIATPNLGAAKAYYFWSGGDLVSRELYKNIIYKLIKTGFIWYIKFKYELEIDMEFIREKIPSVKELLPSYGYGDYLIDKKTKENINIEDMSIKNEFLNNLNSRKDILNERRIKTYTIVGRSIETIDKIKVRQHDERKEKWRDGKPSRAMKTHMGDGTVTCDSSRGVGGKTIYIDCDHTEILSKCKTELAYILNRRNVILQNKEKEFDTVYSIIARDVEIKFGQGEDTSCTVCNIISIQRHDNIQWIMINSLNDKTINIDISPSLDDGKIVITKLNIAKDSIEEKVIDISNQMSLLI